MFIIKRKNAFLTLVKIISLFSILYFFSTSFCCSSLEVTNPTSCLSPTSFLSRHNFIKSIQRNTFLKAISKVSSKDKQNFDRRINFFISQIPELSLKYSSIKNFDLNFFNRLYSDISYSPSNYNIINNLFVSITLELPFESFPYIENVQSDPLEYWSMLLMKMSTIEKRELFSNFIVLKGNPAINGDLAALLDLISDEALSSLEKEILESFSSIFSPSQGSINTKKDVVSKFISKAIYLISNLAPYEKFGLRWNRLISKLSLKMSQLGIEDFGEYSLNDIQKIIQKLTLIYEKNQVDKNRPEINIIIPSAERPDSITNLIQEVIEQLKIFQFSKGSDKNLVKIRIYSDNHEQKRTLSIHDDKPVSYEQKYKSQILEIFDKNKNEINMNLINFDNKTIKNKPLKEKPSLEIEFVGIEQQKSIIKDMLNPGSEIGSIICNQSSSNDWLLDEFHKVVSDLFFDDSNNGQNGELKRIKYFSDLVKYLPFAKFLNKPSNIDSFKQSMVSTFNEKIDLGNISTLDLIALAVISPDEFYEIMKNLDVNEFPALSSLKNTLLEIVPSFYKVEKNFASKHDIPFGELNDHLKIKMQIRDSIIFSNLQPNEKDLLIMALGLNRWGLKGFGPIRNVITYLEDIRNKDRLTDKDFIMMFWDDDQTPESMIYDPKERKIKKGHYLSVFHEVEVALSKFNKKNEAIHWAGFTSNTGAGPTSQHLASSISTIGDVIADTIKIIEKSKGEMSAIEEGTIRLYDQKSFSASVEQNRDPIKSDRRQRGGKATKYILPQGKTALTVTDTIETAFRALSLLPEGHDIFRPTIPRKPDGKRKSSIFGTGNLVRNGLGFLEASNVPMHKQRKEDYLNFLELVMFRNMKEGFNHYIHSLFHTRKEYRDTGLIRNTRKDFYDLKGEIVASFYGDFPAIIMNHFPNLLKFYLQQDEYSLTDLTASTEIFTVMLDLSKKVNNKGNVLEDFILKFLSYLKRGEELDKDYFLKIIRNLKKSGKNTKDWAQALMLEDIFQYMLSNPQNIKFSKLISIVFQHEKKSIYVSYQRYGNGILNSYSAMMKQINRIQELCKNGKITNTNQLLKTLSHFHTYLEDIKHLAKYLVSSNGKSSNFERDISSNEEYIISSVFREFDNFYLRRKIVGSLGSKIKEKMNGWYKKNNGLAKAA